MFRYSINSESQTALPNPSEGLPYIFFLENKNCMCQWSSHIPDINTKVLKHERKKDRKNNNRKHTTINAQPKTLSDQILYNILRSSSHPHTLSFPPYSMHWSNQCLGPTLLPQCLTDHCVLFCGANCIFSPASRKRGGSTRTKQRKKKVNNNKRGTLIKNLITRRKNLYLVCSISPLRSSVSMLQPEVLLKSTIDISSLFYHFQSEDKMLDLR